MTGVLLGSHFYCIWISPTSVAKNMTCQVGMNRTSASSLNSNRVWRCMYTTSPRNNWMHQHFPPTEIKAELFVVSWICDRYLLIRSRRESHTGLFAQSAAVWEPKMWPENNLLVSKIDLSFFSNIESESACKLWIISCPGLHKWGHFEYKRVALWMQLSRGLPHSLAHSFRTLGLSAEKVFHRRRIWSLLARPSIE